MAHSVVSCDATNMVAIGLRAYIERPRVLDRSVANDPKRTYANARIFVVLKDQRFCQCSDEPALALKVERLKVFHVIGLLLVCTRLDVERWAK
jgi:hypothetical protein